MPIASPPIPVGSSAPASFRFDTRKSLLVQIAFYSDAAANEASLIAAGSGARDVVATSTTPVYDANTDPARATTLHAGLEAGFVGGTSVGLAARTWDEMQFGNGLSQVNLSASGGSDPGGATHYRFIINAEVPR